MRMFRIGVCSLVAVLALAISSPASAQKGGVAEAAQAKEHYKKGTKLYDLGKYDEAIHEFEAAYELKDEPVLLYNIAQAYRLANKYAEALRFYRSYLRKFTAANKKDPPNKVEVETKIADMENLIAQQNRIATGPPVDAIGPGQHPQSPTGTANTGTAAGTTTNNNAGTTTNPPNEANGNPAVASNERPAENEPNETNEKVEKAPAPATETPKPGNTKLIAGIAIAVAGVACVGAGIGMGLVAAGKGSDQEKAAQFDPNLESSGKTFQTVGLALDIAGGALVVVGAVVAVLGVRQNQQAVRTAQSGGREVRNLRFLPSVRPGYAGASVQLSF